MSNQIKKPLIEVNGQVIDTSKYDFLFNKETNKTIVDQTNPLLERAKKILTQMEEEEKKHQSHSLISISININK